MHAALDELVAIFKENSLALQASERTLNFRHIGKLLEDIFSNSDFVQEKIRTEAGLTATQWVNKKKNSRRLDRDPRLPSLGKGTSVYLQSINHLIDYLMWGNGNTLNTNRVYPELKVPNEKIKHPIEPRPKRTNPYCSQEFATKFVASLLKDILMIEREKDQAALKYIENEPTSLTQYLKREYQKFKKDPTFIPALKPGMFISSCKLAEDEDIKSSVIKEIHHFTSN